MSETNKPRYFSYDPDCGFDTHDTAEEARSQSEESISYYRDNACDGWSEHVEGICWGVILSEVEETENRPRHEDDGCCPECDFVVDYGLTEAQDPYAELATLRAHVAELTAERDGLAKDAGRYRWLRDCHNDSANVVCVMHDFQLIEDAIGMDRPELLNLDFCVDAMVQK